MELIVLHGYVNDGVSFFWMPLAIVGWVILLLLSFVVRRSGEDYEEKPLDPYYEWKEITEDVLALEALVDRHYDAIVEFSDASSKLQFSRQRLADIRVYLYGYLIKLGELNHAQRLEVYRLDRKFAHMIGHSPGSNKKSLQELKAQRDLEERSNYAMDYDISNPQTLDPKKGSHTWEERKATN